MANISVGYSSRFRSRKLFKGYDSHKGAQLSSSIEEMDEVTLIYWHSKLVMEVAKKSGERYPPKTVYRIVCDALVFDMLHEKQC